MGYLAQITDTGVEVEVHRFDTKELAEHYVTRGRRYVFDRHEVWGMTAGLDFYKGADKERASVRGKIIDGKPLWQAVFWKAS